MEAAAITKPENLEEGSFIDNRSYNSEEQLGDVDAMLSKHSGDNEDYQEEES